MTSFIYRPKLFFRKVFGFFFVFRGVIPDVEAATLITVELYLKRLKTN